MTRPLLTPNLTTSQSVGGSLATMRPIVWAAALTPVPDLGALKSALKEDLEAARSKSRPSISQLRMVGLVFASPDTPLAQSDIFPRISKYHYRSGRHIDFYFAGYAQGGRPKQPDVISVPGPKGTWYYSQKDFDRFRQDIESQTTWRHSGDCDLLLSNGHLDLTRSKPIIDFKSTIVCQLEAMKKDEAFVTVGQFFESIFRFAESYDGDDPTWGFSDQQGLAFLGSGLKRVLMSLLPKGLIQDVSKAEHLAVRDVAAR